MMFLFVPLLIGGPPDALQAHLGQGELTLTPSQAVLRAFEVAPEVQRAQAAVARAQAAVDGAHVGLAPRIELRGSAQRIGGFPDGQISAGPQSIAIEIPRNQASVSAGLVYPLTRLFGEVVPGLASAKARRSAEVHRARATEQALALETLEAYWQYARARGLVQVAQASLDQVEDQAERLRVMDRAGFATPADLAAAEARLEGATQSLVRSQGAAATARAALVELLDLKDVATVAIPAESLGLPAPDARTQEQLFARARSERPERLALQDATTALQMQKRALWGGRLPQVKLSADVTYAQPNRYVVPPQEQFDPSWSVGGTLEWSPSDLWSAETRADGVEADLVRTRSEAAILDRGIRVEIAAQTAAIDSARQTWAASRARVSAAQEAYAARQVAFENGRGIYTEVLEAEAELTSARLSKLEALIDARLAQARLARAIGELDTVD